MKLSFFILTLLTTIATYGSESLNFSEITFVGNSKTKEYVLLNELNFSVNQDITQEDLKGGIENLRNTNLFSSVDFTIQEKENRKILTVKVAERWTTIPIFKVASGGGVSQITLGLFDPNLFGHFLEAGAQYQKLGDTNSGVAWFKNPRLFGKRNGIDVQFWKTDRIRTKYKQDSDEPVEINGFLHSRDKFYLGYTKEWHRKLKGRVFYEYNKDSFSDRFVTDEIKAIINTIGLPPETQFHFAGIGVDLGLINFNNYLVDGSLFSADYRYALSENPNIKNFSQIDLNYRYYKTIFKDHTFAQRFMAGVTTTKTLQYWYYLGGLDRIRGFSDNRFAGNHFFLSNSEWRAPVWKSDWLVAQGVAFFDITSSAETFKDMFSIDGASVGGGARFILPKVYRFVLRFDYAKPLKANDEMNLSFGVQQFF